MIGRRLGTLAVLLGLACTPLAFATGPAEADASGVAVSLSPTGPFRDQLPRQLFADVGKIVPGEQVRRTFYVRNDSDVVARTTLAVTRTGADNDLQRALDVGIDMGDAASTGPLGGDDACTLTTTGSNLAPGGVQAIDVSLSVADLAGTVGAGQRASLDLQVTLTQVEGTGVVETCGEQAVADPTDDDPPSGAPSGDGSCDRGAVVTVTGKRSCVPTAVDAGRQADPDGTGPAFRERVTRSAFPTLLLLGVGGGLLIGSMPLRRRRSVEG